MTGSWTPCDAHRLDVSCLPPRAPRPRRCWMWCCRSWTRGAAPHSRSICTFLISGLSISLYPDTRWQQSHPSLPPGFAPEIVSGICWGPPRCLCSEMSFWIALHFSGPRRSAWIWGRFQGVSFRGWRRWSSCILRGICGCLSSYLEPSGWSFSDGFRRLLCCPWCWPASSTPVWGPATVCSCWCLSMISDGLLCSNYFTFMRRVSSSSRASLQLFIKAGWFQ